MEQHMSVKQLDSLQNHVSTLDVIDSSVAGLSSAGDSSDAESNTRDDSGAAGRLRIMEDAVAECMALTIVHRRDIEEEPLSREVEPYGLIYWHDTWYLVGYCRLRRAIRTFRCDRIIRVSAEGTRFERPPEFSARRYFLEQTIPERSFADEVTVRLEGTPSAVDHFSRHWYYQNYLRERSVRSLGLAIETGEALKFLPDVVISYGTTLRVVEPAELQRAVESAARRVVELYTGGQ